MEYRYVVRNVKHHAYPYVVIWSRLHDYIDAICFCKSESSARKIATSLNRSEK